MGLKFEKTDDLDKLFEEFAIDPEKKVAQDKDINKFLKPNKDKDQAAKNKKIIK